jgi:hypothetical protein
LEKNDSLLTEKYLKKLNKTIVNKREVKALREQLKENVKTNVFSHDSMLFINSLQANNLRIAYLSNPDNVFARDIFFCSLLQRREYNMFCAFCGEYIKENQVLPILYQEALLMFLNIDKGNTVTVSPEFIDRYVSKSVQRKLEAFVAKTKKYKGMKEEEMAPYFKKEYGDTYFYFYFFVRKIKTN